MSYDLIVYLKRDKFPSRQAWRLAILAAGFQVDLTTEFEPSDFAGFLPCLSDGESSGFEYYVGALSQDDARDLEFDREVDTSVQFCTGFNQNELRTALAASSVLATLSDGVLNDPQLANQSWVRPRLSGSTTLRAVNRGSLIADSASRNTSTAARA